MDAPDKSVLTLPPPAGGDGMGWDVGILSVRLSFPQTRDVLWGYVYCYWLWYCHCLMMIMMMMMMMMMMIIQITNKKEKQSSSSSSNSNHNSSWSRSRGRSSYCCCCCCYCYCNCYCSNSNNIQAILFDENGGYWWEIVLPVLNVKTLQGKYIHEANAIPDPDSRGTSVTMPRLRRRRLNLTGIG